MFRLRQIDVNQALGAVHMEAARLFLECNFWLNFLFNSQKIHNNYIIFLIWNFLFMSILFF